MQRTSHCGELRVTRFLHKSPGEVMVDRANLRIFPQQCLDTGRSGSAKSHAITVNTSRFTHQPLRFLPLTKLPWTNLAQASLVRIERLEA